jgi:hypothetical protein
MAGGSTSIDKLSPIADCLSVKSLLIAGRASDSNKSALAYWWKQRQIVKVKRFYLI